MAIYPANVPPPYADPENIKHILPRIHALKRWYTPNPDPHLFFKELSCFDIVCHAINPEMYAWIESPPEMSGECLGYHYVKKLEEMSSRNTHIGDINRINRAWKRYLFPVCVAGIAMCTYYWMNVFQENRENGLTD